MTIKSIQRWKAKKNYEKINNSNSKDSKSTTKTNSSTQENVEEWK